MGGSDWKPNRRLLGTLTLGSIGGFVGNFLLGYIPYKLWGAIFYNSKDKEPSINSGKKLAAYIAVVIVSSAACALVISWFADLIKLAPFAALSVIITINNAIAGIVLGPFILLIIYPRIKQWGLLWTEIMRPEDVSPSVSPRLGQLLVWIGAIGGVIVGLIIALGLYNQAMAAAGFGKGTQGGVALAIIMIPFIALVFIGGWMLGGKEQVLAMQE